MASVIRGDDNFDSKPYASFPIGVPFAILDNFAPVLLPDNSGPIKFIKLTADDSYNDGLLTDESVSGSAPLVEADAEIAVGPLEGLRVPLLNTEGAFVRPGTSSGTLQFDQLIDHVHSIQRGNGNFGWVQNTGSDRPGSGSGNQTQSAVHWNSTEVNQEQTTGRGITDNSGVDINTGNETRPKNRQATYYMRIV